MNGNNFGLVTGAAGVEGFFREGYAHHALLKPLGLTFEGCAFVSKTTTLEARTGNMPLEEGGIAPLELLPRCILPNFRLETFSLSVRMFLEGIMLNSVGLSGPGAKVLFDTGRWQSRTEPFYISFMSVAPTPEQRLAELETFIELFMGYKRTFKTTVGLQINRSCPNIGINPDGLICESKEEMKIVHHAHVPTVWKFNILAPPSAIREIFRDNHNDGICISNTVLWGKLPEIIDWVGLFGTEISPLAKFGGGGLSGKPLLPLVADWVKNARSCGIKNYINAGGGILSPKDVVTLRKAGANSCFIGSVANLRWWRMRKIIATAQKEFGLLP
jgi:dihydroorotate dehydrogenase